MNNAPDLSVQLAQSAGTDIGVLLRAKEEAKRQVMEAPSQANLAALERAAKMLDAAQSVRTAIKDANAVLAYIEEAGRKLKKTKLYEDIKIGRLKKQPDGSFKIRDVDRYAATLPTAGTPDRVAVDAAARQKRREAAEIRRIENAADREKFRHAVERGKFIARDQVFLELAGRAVTLAAGLKTAFESAVLDLIHMVEGNPKKAQNLTKAIEEKLDEAFNTYSQIEEFEILFTAPEMGAPAEADEQEESEA